MPFFLRGAVVVSYVCSPAGRSGQGTPVKGSGPGDKCQFCAREKGVGSREKGGRFDWEFLERRKITPGREELFFCLFSSHISNAVPKKRH